MGNTLRLSSSKPQPPVRLLPKPVVAMPVTRLGSKLILRVVEGRLVPVREVVAVPAAA